jgi:hypothetical protein
MHYKVRLRQMKLLQAADLFPSYELQIDMYNGISLGASLHPACHVGCQAILPGLKPLRCCWNEQVEPKRDKDGLCTLPAIDLWIWFQSLRATHSPATKCKSQSQTYNGTAENSLTRKGACHSSCSDEVPSTDATREAGQPALQPLSAYSCQWFKILPCIQATHQLQGSRHNSTIC